MQEILKAFRIFRQLRAPDPPQLQLCQASLKIDRKIRPLKHIKFWAYQHFRRRLKGELPAYQTYLGAMKS